MEAGAMKRDIVKYSPVNRNLSRREMLGLVGTTAAAVLVGCEREQSGSTWLTSLRSRKPTVMAMPPCIVRPEQTEGPYFVDDRHNRSDIRSDPSDGLVKEGVPLQLALRVYQIRGNDCTPLAGAMVDIWHCDALGVYSDVRDRSFDTRGRKFLRGYQMTNAKGTSEFITIYPGWYPGRTVHIHFKIRTNPESRRGYEFTAQLYFDEALTDQIHAQAPYAAKGHRTSRNKQDGIFRDGGEQLMLQLTQQPQGYVGMFDIGLQIT
jgi:protocatechuate 3,4-dioxygenase beta subunit